MDELCAAAVPAALRARAQWVVRRKVMRGGRMTARPFRADGGGPARAGDPATWAPFAVALAACRSSATGGGAGVGYVFSADDPYAVVSLGDCRDAATGAVAAWARAILDRLDTYCEVSPTGTGVQAWVRARCPGPRGGPARWCGGTVECIGRGRWCAMTGRRLPDYPPAVGSRQAALGLLYEHVFACEEEAPASGRTPPSRLGSPPPRSGEDVKSRPQMPLSSSPGGGGGEPRRDGGVRPDPAAVEARAQRLLAWLARTGRAGCSRREAQRRLTATAAQAGDALDLLAARGDLRALPPVATSRAGRPASPAYRVVARGVKSPPAPKHGGVG